jgi:hypothetical protein
MMTEGLKLAKLCMLLLVLKCRLMEGKIK